MALTAVKIIVPGIAADAVIAATAFNIVIASRARQHVIALRAIDFTAPHRWCRRRRCRPWGRNAREIAEIKVCQLHVLDGDHRIGG